MKQLRFESKINLRLDPSHTPAWSTQVERWYQLDELGFSFCEALHHWKGLQEFKKPDLIILAIEGASNLADKDFVITGSASPAKFVYTLPNISAAIIFQMLKFEGKVFCVSEGSKTFEVANQEAEALASSGKSVWLFSTKAESSAIRTIVLTEF